MTDSQMTFAVTALALVSLAQTATIILLNRDVRRTRTIARAQIGAVVLEIVNRVQAGKVRQPVPTAEQDDALNAALASLADSADRGEQDR
ncbi:hypothetical protein [Sphingomonas sp.]|uniref:hypothetical protein n=1 Tax=Sphingomonas sp. TaxID=28214 RepID=UPI003F6FFC59